MRWVVDHYLIIGFGNLLFYSKIFLPKIQLLKNDTQMTDTVSSMFRYLIVS